MMPDRSDGVAMGLDLRFSRGSGLESGFRAQRILAGYRTHCRTEVMRTAAWIIAATKAYLEGSRGAAAGLALGALSSAALLPLYVFVNRKLVLSLRGQIPLRLLFAAVVAVNLLQCLLGLLFFQAIYPEGENIERTSAFARMRACMLAVVACGVMWLVFYGRMSPLPFRYQWPQLSLAAGMMIWATGRMCGNSNLQAGHAELHRVLRHMVLPILLPATAYSLPDSHGLQAGPGPEAQALCQTHQPAVVVIGLTAVLLSIYHYEAQQRARLLRCVRQQQAEEHAQLRARSQQPGRASSSARTATPGGTSAGAAARPLGSASPAGPAGPAPLSPAASLQQSGAASSSLLVAAQQRALVWLLAAVYVYILWSSWPAMAAHLPPAASGT